MTGVADVERMARAIVEAWTARGTVATNDLAQAGFEEADTKRLYDRAFARACEIEPAMLGHVA